jgi:NitT/TauT family transport system ATP-binding protein
MSAAHDTFRPGPLAQLDLRRGGGRLVVDDMSHAFESNATQVEALASLDLTIEPGEFVAIVGQSGCGKSTLLNILSGLLTPTKGQARIEGLGADDGFPVVGYITQHDSLLPWRTVIQNAAFALELHGISKHERLARARVLLERLGLSEFQHRYPHELSGGMKQRLSLARTLIYRPLVLLMDEPFGALDAQIRSSLHALLLEIWRESGTTIVFVTHDLLEAITLADRIVTLSSRPGRIQGTYALAVARPRDITRIQSDPVLSDIHHRVRADLGRTP